jgi:hypothetical protein
MTMVPNSQVLFGTWMHDEPSALTTVQKELLVEVGAVVVGVSLVVEVEVEVEVDDEVSVVVGVIVMVVIDVPEGDGHERSGKSS